MGNKLHYLLWACCVLYLPVWLAAQDAHYTQFGYAQFQISPSLTGVFQGDQRYTVNLRRQWWNVPVAYQQMSGAFDKRFRRKNGDESPWAAGIVVSHDIAGDSRLYSAEANLLGSYTQILTKRQFLSVGVLAGAGHRGFDDNNLSFDDQYDGETNTLPTQEPFERFGNNHLNFSAGLNWRWKGDTTRTVFDAGVGFLRLNTPQNGFWSDPDFESPRRFTAYLLGTWQLSRRLDFITHVVFQHQGPHREWLISAYGRTHISQQTTRELAIQYGIGYRGQDAFYPQFIVQYQTWHVGLSYDVNLSKFRTASLSNGGPELSIIYIFRKVPRLNYCPTCPKYM